jgi:hypothetical protein
VRRRSSNDLGNVPVEPFLDRLQGISRKRYGISLFLDVNTDNISGLEGAIRNTIFGSYEEAMFSSANM